MNSIQIYRGFVISRRLESIKVLSTFGEDVFPQETFTTIKEAEEAIDPLADQVERSINFIRKQLSLPERNNVIKLCR